MAPASKLHADERPIDGGDPEFSLFKVHYS
jgi:hypothetical protein